MKTAFGLTQNTYKNVQKSDIGRQSSNQNGSMYGADRILSSILSR